MIEPKTKLSIDGEFLYNFESVSLVQNINDHHTFEMILDYESVEAIGGHTLDVSKKWLGKPVGIIFDEREFMGLITNVRVFHDNGFEGKLIISGYSKTILLEAGEHMQSWLDKNLTTIVEDTVKQVNINATVSPVYSGTIAYQSQYMESHFQFIQRLAKQHNEWFYYNGIELIFGKPTLEASIPIEYGKDMDSINIGIQTLPNSSNNFSYNSLDDAKHESKTKDTVSGLNELGSFAFDESNKFFSIQPNSFSSARVKDKSEIDTVLKNRQASIGSQVHMLTGTSTKQGLTIGSVIKVHAAQYSNGAFEEKAYGEYIIIQISHHATGSSEYNNEFTAIPAGVEILPEPLVQLPQAHPQLATVLSNEDPKSKGRVQVQFQWQSGDMKTSWLRVMTPDAGKSDIVGTNRGFVHIPEVDDQVMIGFRYNDPNRPFVMGSLFSGTTGAGGSDNNKTKSLTTRSGSTITFDDDEEKGNISIVDGAGNVVSLNGKDTVSISANATISLSTGESSITLASDGTISIVGKNISISGSETTSMSTSDSTFNTEAGKSSVNGGEVNIDGTKTVTVNGASKATVSSSATTSIEGTIVKLN